MKKASNNLTHRVPITDDYQKLISEYFQSKAERFCIKKYPGWDVARSGPEIGLLKCKRELAESQKELEESRKKYAEQRTDLNQQWAEMRRKETLLKESLIKFDEFIKENCEKRERAQRKITEEQQSHDRYQQEIVELEEKKKNLIQIRDKMESYTKNYKIAQNYLESVISETGEFQSINDIFNRYENLIKVRETLTDHQNKYFQSLETISTNMQKMTVEKNEKLMGLNNELSSLQSRYDRIKAESLKWESVISQIKTTAFKKNLELIQVRSACWNLYQQMCQRKGIPIEISKDDVENQLIQIKQTIKELKSIVKTAKQKTLQESKK